ncbi:MAG: universal stress protein [Dehalococcoidia bacterium]
MTTEGTNPRSKILVPVDEGDGSFLAITSAADAARVGGGSLILVTVAPLPETSEQRDEAIEVNQRRLEQLAHRVRDVPVETRVSLAGDPVRGIVEVARDEGVERIVMAHGSDDGLLGFFDSSIAAELHEQAPVPVTVLQPSD